MKRLVLFGIAIFLIIIGGFLVVDKVWLHKVFKITPGSCLILEEKYCKTGIVDYIDNKPMAIKYKIKNNTPIFSPITEKYTKGEAELNDGTKKRILTIGNTVFKIEEKTKSDGYQILFNGNFVKNIENEDIEKIKKGSIFAYFLDKSKKENMTIILIPIKTSINDFGQIQIDTNEEKIKEINNETKNK